MKKLLNLNGGGLGPQVVHVLRKLVIFMTKQKSPKQILECEYFLLKILQEAMYVASPTWAKSPPKSNPQIQNFKRVLDLICK